MASGIVKMPVELCLKVVEYLGVKDFHSLKATDKRLFHMLKEETFSRAVLQVSTLSQNHRNMLTLITKAQCQILGGSKERRAGCYQPLEVSQ